MAVRFGMMLLVVCASVSVRAEHPQATIANSQVTARLYLPQPDSGYYRGTRFDWSGVIYSLQCDGHEYFGEWQKSDDPYLHDRITGPVESYSVGPQQRSGETFLRIGVGVCDKAKPTAKHPFRVVDHGQWKVKKGGNWIEMQHVVKHGETGYHYVKRLTLTSGRPELVIDHFLHNTGAVPIETQVYNHNFFVMDQQPTGPDFVVRFPFELTAERDLGGFGAVRGKNLVYLREIPDGDYMISTFRGFETDDVRHHGFWLENRKIKAGVRMATDRPLAKLQLWSPHTTICPEPFIDLKIEPGNADRWSIRYTFYTL